jgi:co-chaperonin GroES (HSP10)
MAKAENIRALGEMVIIKFVKAETANKTAGGLILLEEKEVKYHAIIDGIGNRVEDDIGFKVGDKIIFNQHDIMAFDEQDPDFPLDPTKTVKKGLIQAKSVWGVYS